MHHTRTAVLATFATGALLGSGCGGSSDDALSKADLAKKADAICVKYNAKTKALGDPTDKAGFLAYFDKLLPITAEQGKELKALKPDDAAKTQWTALLKDYDTISAAAKQAQTALQGGDETEFQRIVEDTSVVGDASDKKLDAFGAPHCGTKSDA